MNKVIVIGGDHHNTLGVIRSLGEKELCSDLILVTNAKRTFVDVSKYLRKSWIIQRDEEIVDVLLQQYISESEKPVVICCSDSSSGIVDENYDKLKAHFYLPGAHKQGTIAGFMSKKIMADLAEEVGLKIPNTFYVNDEIKLHDHICTPCIIKPIESRKGQKSDISICYNQKMLSDYICKCKNVKNIQIQEYIEKEFEFQLIGCSTKKEVIIPGVSKIIRPCKGSNTSFLYYTPYKDGFCEIEKCVNFVRRTGYYGLFSMEFLRDKNGADYFMEINFRNDGNAICTTAAGINLPYIWYLDCIGNDYMNETIKKLMPIYVMPDMAELKLLFTGKINLFHFLGDLWKTGRFMEFDKRDWKPFVKLLVKEVVRW